VSSRSLRGLRLSVRRAAHGAEAGRFIS
jgi:hypothetical protein